MKQLYYSLILVLFVVACKNQANNEVDLEAKRAQSYDQNDGLITMKGEFVYYADAAVLQTKNDIYGVVINEMMHKLNTQVRPLKTADTDMVPVTVRVKKFEKPANEEGWPYRVEIIDILKVETPDTNKDDVITIAN